MRKDTKLPRLLTAREVSEATGLKRQRVYELTRMGLIPAMRIGASYRYPEDQLLQWIRDAVLESGG